MTPAPEAPQPPPGGGDETAPAPRPALVHPRSVEALVAEAVATWRAALSARADSSALTDVTRLGDAQLDLSAAHPSGTAQLFAGRETRLSNLVREGSALASAKRSARAVTALAQEHAARYGLASAFLAIGVASWLESAPDGATPTVVRAPVLLRPVAIRPRGRGDSDYDLTLEPSLDVNPLLAGALRRRGALLDPAALARGAFAESGFDPRPALDRLRGLGEALLDGFTLDDRLLVGTFVHPEQVLVDDLDALASQMADHEVLRALAGDARAVAALHHPLPEAIVGDRSIDNERGVGDLDAAQYRVLDAVAGGHHLLVDAPPGADVAGTVAAIVADAAAAGRTVLHVAGHRRAGTALTERLELLGLGDLALDIAPDSGWRAQVAQRLLSAMTVQPVDVDEEKIVIVQRELARRRERLSGYIEALHERREPWATSAYDALQALARLTSGRPAPQTRVRLSPAVAEAMNDERRAQATTDLVRAADLGAFDPAATSSPWHGADLVTPQQAEGALDTARRLLSEELPELRTAVTETAESTGLAPAGTLAQWGAQLRLLDGVRHALDVFRPLVFERSAADLVAATAPKAWRAERDVEMTGMVRRRLVKQAKDMVRPGHPVADLHGALVDVQALRETWMAHSPGGGWPRLPEGLARLAADHRAVLGDVEELSDVLGAARTGGDLSALPWGELEARLRRLLADDVALERLPERTALVQHLRRQGLGELLDDLERRHVPVPLVAAELDLAWWSTVFEAILAVDPTIAGYDGTALARLAAEFRTLDRRHLQDRARWSLAASREVLRTRLRAADTQTQELFAEIVEHRFAGLRPAVERYGEITRHLRPCLVGSPMLVPHLLPAARTEDVVVLDAAGHLPLEVVVQAVARARQVVVVGDTRSASGTALTALAQVLPVIALHADASRRDPHLTTFLQDHGYADVLTATPLPVSRSLLSLDVVDGSGVPTSDGEVETTRAEVEHVVEMVVDHALSRPEESLAVVCGSRTHADRVRDAVLAEVRDNPALGQFFRAGATEPFAVVEIGGTQGLSRETVLLSLGYGRTPHGRVLHRFGVLSEPSGDGALLEAVGAARHRLQVVSCFRAAELDRDRLKTPGLRMLADLLALAESRTVPAALDDQYPAAGGLAEADLADPDRLVLDLAERLWRAGLTVELHHGVPGGTRLPLVVGHPDVHDEWLVAVLTDDEEYVAEPSLRVRDRQVTERLESLGWTVAQVWSAALFLDPQGEADAIAALTADAAGQRLGQIAAMRRGGATRAPRADVAPTSPEVDAGVETADPASEVADGDVAEDVALPVAEPAEETVLTVPAAQEQEPEPEPEPESAEGVQDAEPADDAADAEQAEDVQDEAPGDDGGSAAEHVVTLLDVDPGEERPAAPPATPVHRSLPRWDPPIPPGWELEPLLPVRGPRPAVQKGLPIGAYTADQLDELVAWILADGVERDDAALGDALRRELGVTRRGVRVETAVRSAVRRAR